MGTSITTTTTFKHNMSTTGSCLCGACTINISQTFPDQTICHCTDCQHTSGSGFSVNVLSPIEATKFNGPVKEYSRPAASGKTVTRVFCSECGSALAHKSAAFEPAMAVQTGNLANFPQKAPIAAELFVRTAGLDSLPSPALAKFLPCPR